MTALLGVGGSSLIALACGEPGGRTVTSHAAVTTSTDASLRADCVGCHVVDFQRAHGPGKRHQVPTTCAVCHSETGYHPAQRVHPWPLTGKHDGADCFACHDQKPPVYRELDGACVACHRDDYDASEYPGHDKFALTCADCHGTDAWKGAKKPQKPAETAHAHETTPAPSAPSPATPTATKPKRTKPKSTQPKSTSATSAALRPTASTPPPELPPLVTPTAPSAASQPAQREHPEASFPLTRGNHVDIACADCHSGPGKDSKANTSCVSCHKRSRYDGKHGDVADYPLGAAPAYFCVECHTQGTRRVRR